jgi:SagB-type dehydrogenase family enzyme
MTSSIGDEFQSQTKHTRSNIGGYLDWANKPSIYKNYPAAKKIKLTYKFPEQARQITEILQKRRSVRSFSPKPLSNIELSFLIWASTGVQRREHGYDFRTAPSAGALYPIETYIVVNNVETFEKGLYHYNIEEHALEELKLGDFGGELSQAALEQEMLTNAPLIFVWTAIFERSKWKYRQRAYRYVYLDAGIIGENLALSATGISLGSCQVGAFFDDEVNEILGVDGVAESVVYLSVVGHPLGPHDHDNQCDGYR